MRERPLREFLDNAAEAERLRLESERLAAEARVDLRAARLDAGLTQSDLAAAMGVTKAYVSQVENGYPTSTGALLRFAQTIEGGAHASSKERRSAKEDLEKARGEA